MILRRRSTTAASPALDPTVQALRGAAADAQRSRLTQMAAALSYRAVFGIVPVLAVGLWVLHNELSPQELEGYVGKVLETLGLSAISIDPAAVGPPAPLHASTGGQAATLAESQSLKAWISGFVDRLNGISFRAIGLVGMGMLIYAAVSMVVEIERAFNQIFRVPRGRSWSRRIVNYWTLITLGSVGLIATFYMQQKLNTLVGDWTSGLGWGAVALTVAGLSIQIIVSASVLILLYMVVPNTRVRFWPALCGALLAAAMFECSKFAFGKYVEFSAGQSYTRLYGSLALIPLFLLWVYFTWMIVLFGMQLTYQLQHGRAQTRAQPMSEFGPSVAEPTGALVVMSAAAASFAEGHTVDAPALARRTRLGDGVVRLILAALCDRRLLHRLESEAAGTGTAAAEPTYTLARSPETIRVSELLEVGYELARRGGELAAGEESPVVTQLRQAHLAAAGERTLSETLKAGSPSPTAPSAPHTERSAPGPTRTVGNREREPGASRGADSPA
ncbi:MAG: YihY/virulence factor BrkB family protein [Phycisphaerales bacterium]|nr:YihY/virulence factor BrkB family protein [Phycisphaerales bacterium]